MSLKLARTALAVAFGATAVLAAGGAAAEITSASLKVVGTWPNITNYYAYEKPFYLEQLPKASGGRIKAQLNPLTDPRAMPPFPRQEVNRVLRESGVLPAKVERTLVRRSRLSGRKKEIVHRSEHDLTWTLRAADHRKVDEIGELMATCEEVDLAAYCRGQLAQADR